MYTSKPVARTSNAACGAAIGVNHWAGYQMSFEHLYFFSLEDIERYGEQVGFRVVGSLTGGGNGLAPPPVPSSVLGDLRRSAKKAILSRTHLIGAPVPIESVGRRIACLRFFGRNAIRNWRRTGVLQRTVS